MDLFIRKAGRSNPTGLRVCISYLALIVIGTCALLSVCES
jgi:hypothetical protein